jgi:putative transposase
LTTYAPVDTALSCSIGHLVFVTKYRHRVLADRHRKRMEEKEIMRAVSADFET